MKNKGPGPRDFLGRLFYEMSGIESEKNATAERDPSCLTLLQLHFQIGSGVYPINVDKCIAKIEVVACVITKAINHGPRSSFVEEESTVQSRSYALLDHLFW